jgi:hypothetical protein
LITERDKAHGAQAECYHERQPCANGARGSPDRHSSQHREPDSLALGIKARNFVMERVGALQ